MEPRLKEQNFSKWESTARDGKEFQKAKGTVGDKDIL
jgi:probable phosphoglycerate mutase